MSISENINTDGRTIFLTLIEKVEESYVRDILTKCAEHIGIEVPNFIINIVNRYCEYNDTYIPSCGFINCIDTTLFKAILDLDDEFKDREDEDNHSIDFKCLKKCRGLVYDVEEKIILKIYDPYYRIRGIPSKTISSSMKFIKKEEMDQVCNEIRKYIYKFEQEPRIYFTKNYKGYRFMNIKFASIDDAQYSLPFLTKIIVDVNGKKYVFMFSFKEERS